jgi:hypothetical protein
MKRLLFALLCASSALAVPRPSQAQATGMTLDQYMVMQERVDAFCSFYADQVAGSKPWPAAGAGLRIPTVGNLAYVYSATEVQALMKHCKNLMELMKKAHQ